MLNAENGANTKERGNSRAVTRWGGETAAEGRQIESLFGRQDILF
jgi:hypothetical protein